MLRYNTLKEKVRVGAKTKSLELDEATRKELAKRGRKEADHSFLKKIGVEVHPRILQGSSSTGECATHCTTHCTSNVLLITVESLYSRHDL